MIGQDFDGALAAAQEGSEAAFSRLWRDGNPALLRYLRVMAPEIAEDVVADTWLQVVRGLAAFRGDEQAWRAWLFTSRRRSSRCATRPGGTTRRRARRRRPAQQHDLHAGPTLRGLAYETTAIPEIRDQAAALARHLTAATQAPTRPSSAA